MSEDNGRKSDGTFAPGNSFSRGNVNGKRAAEWRAVLDEEITPERLKNVVQKLLLAALKGEPWAIKEVLLRCVGTPISGNIEERLAELERKADELCKS
jgi:hypothetical protein